MELNTGLVAAIGGAAVLVAIAFRQLVDTVIKLNQELSKAIEERRTYVEERDTLHRKIDELEAQIADLERRLEAQSREISAFQAKVDERDRMIAILQGASSLAN